jgi:hypothetical protein
MAVICSYLFANIMGYTVKRIHEGYSCVARANSGGQPATYPKNIRGSFPVVKWAGYVANHSCLFSAEAKNEWSCTFTLPHGRDRDNFTLTDLLQILKLILTLPPLLLLLFCALLYLLALHLADTTSSICTVFTFLKVNSISIISCSYVCDMCHTKCQTASSCGSLVITIKMKATENF